MTLSEIKQHPLFPFKDFKTNDTAFLMLELFWTAIAYEALGEKLSQQCQPIMSANRDGNSILFFWLPKANRAIKVILFDIVDDMDETIDGEEYLYSPLYMYIGNCMTSYTSSDGYEIDKLVIDFDMNYLKYEGFIIDAIRAYLIHTIENEKMDENIEKLHSTIGHKSTKEMMIFYKNYGK